MEQFLISPQDCLILKAFRDSASLREAAILLNCDPAGLQRKVQVIADDHGLLAKVNNRWQVTARGLDLVAWVEDSIQSQRKLLSLKNSLRVASTMWFAEELLIPHLPRNFTLSFSTPENFELALRNGTVDFVIVCHPPENPEIAHKQILPEKWVVVMPKSWSRNVKSIEDLRDKPFIRHSSVNTDLFLSELGHIQDSSLLIDNMIGVRSAILAGHGWGIVPKILVQRLIAVGKIEELKEITLPDRKVCLWWLRNRTESQAQAPKLSAWIKEICP